MIGPYVVLVLVFLTLAAVFGQSLRLGLDEGIFLVGAEHVARGSVPYLDFFSLTGPWTSWLYGLMFSLFGTSVKTAHVFLSMILACAALASVTLLDRLIPTWLAMGCGLFFLGFVFHSPYHLYVTHRWDSNSLAVMSIAVVCAGLSSTSWKYTFSAGILIGAATLATPSFIVVFVAIAIWLVVTTGANRFNQPLLLFAGAALPIAAAVAYLSYKNALAPMIQQLYWTSKNYGTANHVAFGQLLGDPNVFFADHLKSSKLILAIRFAESLVPALLPICAYTAWAILFWRKPKEIASIKQPISFLLCMSFAILLTCYPRWGGAQLVFVSAIFWVLGGAALYYAFPQRNRTRNSAIVLASAILLIAAAAPSQSKQLIKTRVGDVRCSRSDCAVITALHQRITPGQSLFVFPYMPIIYFVTGGVNPTRYSYLQPGMMTSEDEANVLSDLLKKPPRWTFWQEFNKEMILKSWPDSNPSRLTFPDIEGFIETNYHAVFPTSGKNIGFRLMEHN